MAQQRRAGNVQAFHSANPAVVEEILEQRHIQVGMARLLPSIWLTDCPARIREMMNIVLDEGAGTVNEPALQALDDLSVEMAEAMHAWQKANGMIPTGTETDFQCVDFLAGDLDFVFLSVGGWVKFANDEPSGFVFDAEELLRNGAILRLMDLGPRYAAALRELLVKPWKSYSKARDGILAALAGVQSQGQLHGKQAIEFLRTSWALNSGRPPEILWQGDLPVSLAKEVWIDGAQRT